MNARRVWWAAMLVHAVIALVAAQLLAHTRRGVPHAASGTFKVATWNIRSGMGIDGTAPNPEWSSTTRNCTDPARIMNAWGVGLPQRYLQQIADDTQVVALAVQEAWYCGSVKQINTVLKWKAASRDYNGVGLLTRHGIVGKWVHVLVGQDYLGYIVGADVCLDSGCTETIRIYSTHWGGDGPEKIIEARNALAYMKTLSTPQILMGDLNVYRIDRWNPQVPCTNRDTADRNTVIDLVAAAGFLDAWKTTQAGEGWTGMSSRNGCGDPNGNLFKRIDYIHYKGLTAVGTQRIGRVAPGAPAPSDHVALVAEFSQNAASAPRKTPAS